MEMYCKRLKLSVARGMVLPGTDIHIRVPTKVRPERERDDARSDAKGRKETRTGECECGGGKT